jgi:hypothetical protein
MDNEGQRPHQYRPEQWRDDDVLFSDDDREFRAGDLNPDAREQSRLLDLLGRINYRILSGNKVYVEVGGVVYKTLYGGYWCSVFTGIQHYLLRCEEIPTSIWSGDSETSTVVDLPIAYSKEGWTARGYSLSFMLSKD